MLARLIVSGDALVGHGISASNCLRQNQFKFDFRKCAFTRLNVKVVVAQVMVLYVSLNFTDLVHIVAEFMAREELHSDNAT